MPEATEVAASEPTATSSEPTQDQFADEAANIFDAEVAKKPEVKSGEAAPKVEEGAETVKTDEELAAEVEAAKQAKADKAAEAQKAAAAQPKDIFPEIEKLHPGARQKASTPDFQAWLNTLPANVQAMVDSGDIRGSAAVMDMYDMMKAGQPAQQQEQAAKAQEAAPAEFKPFTFDQLKDVKFKDESGNEQTLADFRGQYAEIGDAVLAMLNTILPQVLKGAGQGPSGDFIAKSDFQAYQAKMDGELFESRVERGAPGAMEKVVTPEFKAFIENASPIQKRMFTEGQPKDVIEVLKEFDRVQGVEKTKAAQQKQRDRKASLDGVHGNSLRSSSSTEKPADRSGETQRDPEQDEIDAREAFDKAANESAKNKRW